uniref:Uncharacterized protein n=1 Tax=Arundo donax TaxID=35708 RepID=A0A0A9FUG6_ARUDO
MAWFVQTRLFNFCNLLQRMWQFCFLLSLVFHCTLKLIGYLSKKTSLERG